MQKFTRGKAEVLRNKVLMMRNYMATIDSDQVVAFVDSFDSIIYATPSELLERWDRALRRQNV